VAEDDACRAKEDVDIQSQGPVTQVMQVVLHAAPHLLQALSLAPKSVDLCPTSDTGTNLVPQHVTIDELAILLVVSYCVRAQTNQNHAAEEDVKQLRYLIERCPTQETTEGCHARIAPGHLRHFVVVFAH